jgi:hypothetical protein
MEISDSTSIAVSDRFFRQSMTALNDPIGESGIFESLRAGLARMDMLEKALAGILIDQGPI